MDNQVKIGDLVQLKSSGRSAWTFTPRMDQPSECAGVVIGFDGCEPIVFWNEKFPNETEYMDQLETIS